MVREIDFDDNKVFHVSHPEVLSIAQKKWGEGAVEQFVRLGYYYYSLNFDCFYTDKDLVDGEVKLVDFTMNEKYFNQLNPTTPVYSGGGGGGGGSGGNFWLVLLLTLALIISLARCVYG